MLIGIMDQCNDCVTDQEAYDLDPRISCKYGMRCYQKNSHHLQKFKHPPKQKLVRDEGSSPPSKKLRTEVEDESQDNFEDSSKDDSSTSSESEEELVPYSPKDFKENIKQKFLFEMPQDFYDFWQFCSSLNEQKPEDALSLARLTLTGPYDLLSQKKDYMKSRNLSTYLCHWRFYRDPPEFQTIIVGNSNEYHIGYFRDHPTQFPVFVGSMSSLKAGTIFQMGDNLFAAISSYLNSELKSCDIFKKCDLTKLLKEVEEFAKSKGYSTETKTAKLKERNKKIVSKSFHGAGIVVPVQKETDVGYREIPETNANLKKILQKIIDAPDQNSKEKCYEVLQEILTNVQFANDEGDFGMGLELGIDLLVFGGEDFDSAILHLLTVAYDLLDRPQFGKILKAHLKNRLEGSDMSRFY